MSYLYLRFTPEERSQLLKLLSSVDTDESKEFAEMLEDRAFESIKYHYEVGIEAWLPVIEEAKGKRRAELEKRMRADLEKQQGEKIFLPEVHQILTDALQRTMKEEGSQDSE